ncbi:hypothetical protein J2T06_000850 [Enterobacter ludwigii]|nr:hypothetical protein [Enterobacter ludwigii]
MALREMQRIILGATTFAFENRSPLSLWRSTHRHRKIGVFIVLSKYQNHFWRGSDRKEQ